MSNDEIARIGELIRTQDNRITAHPLFVVQQRNRIYGVDYDFAADFVWVDDTEYNEVGAETSEQLERRWKAGREPKGYRRLGYVDRWEFVTACFTEQGCKDYIASNGHNLREPRIYACSAYRNREWQLLRDHLAAMTTERKALERTDA